MASMILASSKAKFLPTQDLGPAENGRTYLSSCLSLNRAGSNLNGSFQYLSELDHTEKYHSEKDCLRSNRSNHSLMQHMEIEENPGSFLYVNFFSVAGDQPIVFDGVANNRRDWLMKSQRFLKNGLSKSE